MARNAGVVRSPLHGITVRELVVLADMATGKTISSIARSLYMSDRAVEKHIGAVFTKLGLGEEDDVNRRVMAVLTFLDATARTR
jgi:DNA-binding NarL/FixJ family response regulator